MNSLKLGTFAFFVLVVLNLCTSQVELKKLKSRRRFYIIRCCGRRSCTNMRRLKKANRTLTTQPTKFISNPLKTLPTKISLETEVNVEETKTEAAPEIADVDLTLNTLKGSQQPISATKTEFTNIIVTGERTTSAREMIETITDSANVSSTNFFPPHSINTILNSADTVLISTVPRSSTTIEPSSISSTAQIRLDSMMTSTISTDTISNNMASISSTTIKLSISSTTATPTTAVPFTVRTTVPFDCSLMPCEKNNSLFDRNSNLIDPQKYGAWREICGELFLLGKSITTWENNAKRCCSIGMRPLAFETDEKFNCFKAQTTKEVWHYNFNYWTSGRRGFANSSFQWCYYNNSESFANMTSMWAKGFPANSPTLDCVHLSVLKNMNGTELTQKSCTNTFVFSCKGKPTTAPPRCIVPSCSSLNCSKNDSLTTFARGNVYKYIGNPSNYGIWKTVNSRIYMFSSKVKSWSEAITFCCSIGMKLLSLDMSYKYSALSLALASEQSSLFGKYWTSGTDNGCNDVFGWCVVNKLVRGPIWGHGEPQTGKHCIATDVNGASVTLTAADCSTNLPFICEVRDSLKSTSYGKAIQNECASNFNISEIEIDTILNSTSFDVKIKCFLKCLAENGEMVINGRVVEEQLLKLVEFMSTGDNTQLMSDFKTVDECSKIQGMDECDTVALVFQCGQEKDPILVKNSMKIVELNDSAEQSPLQPAIGQCITNYPCVMTRSGRQIFLTNSAVVDGFVLDICGKRYTLGTTHVYQENVCSDFL
ncbi:Hypothetical predicted protein [Cloeon dipterum]|uniref:C-type lectin domain-containing protein n=1 Tax=Cloeon dipterum TaxID=197152 RepID=A0A8S1DCI4_9INSE|nr:Hypothetical predicted protein [Cloeon dipterum]